MESDMARERKFVRENMIAGFSYKFSLMLLERLEAMFSGEKIFNRSTAISSTLSGGEIWRPLSLPALSICLLLHQQLFPGASPGVIMYGQDSSTEKIVEFIKTAKEILKIFEEE